VWFGLHYESRQSGGGAYHGGDIGGARIMIQSLKDIGELRRTDGERGL